MTEPDVTVLVVTWRARELLRKCLAALDAQRAPHRLLTLTRCAPAGFALRQLARFGLTTGSLAAKRVRRRPLPPAPHFRVGLRLRVLGSYARLLPWAPRTRRQVPRRSTVDRAALARQWLG